MKLKAFFKKQFNLLTQRLALILNDLGQRIPRITRLRLGAA